MSGKASHPCRVCGRHLKTHRMAKAPACSKGCRDELKRHNARAAYLKTGAALKNLRTLKP